MRTSNRLSMINLGKTRTERQHKSPYQRRLPNKRNRSKVKLRILKRKTRQLRLMKVKMMKKILLQMEELKRKRRDVSIDQSMIEFRVLINCFAFN